MKGYQMKCKSEMLCFGGKVMIFSKIIYTNKDDVTEDVINGFKERCIDGGGITDLDRNKTVITVEEVDIII